ncbi:hypothetical protein F544_11770 [Bibersteinia trehalosi USDA-ARS-USMARC-190]|uniref:Uncharacterized protein n=1 Tax=Bibersteinia trehalosi USDA-ARS-USMARC-190 TaxID=1263832 RepID=W0R7X4_BIBTR|nr:hypothetical protein F544_11770 [Bibersteinia trehalosi USDA-ARS-USMARC-190]
MCAYASGVFLWTFCKKLFFFTRLQIKNIPLMVFLVAD